MKLLSFINAWWIARLKIGVSSWPTLRSGGGEQGQVRDWMVPDDWLMPTDACNTGGICNMSTSTWGPPLIFKPPSSSGCTFPCSFHILYHYSSVELEMNMEMYIPSTSISTSVSMATSSRRSYPHSLLSFQIIFNGQHVEPFYSECTVFDQTSKQQFKLNIYSKWIPTIKSIS